MNRREIEVETLGPRYQVRLDDLRSWHALRVTCKSCCHVSLIYPRQLFRQWPGYTRLISLEDKFRCTACGNRRGNHWQVCRLPRD